VLRFEEVHPEIVEFLHDRDDLPPQLNDFQWFLDLVFLTDLTGKLIGLNT
jgi:hypothetical protein